MALVVHVGRGEGRGASQQDEDEHAQLKHVRNGPMSRRDVLSIVMAEAESVFNIRSAMRLDKERKE